ncbi:unnamed protein product [Gongylonema pulchrum]|uniref:RES domain-containing protein n=1 Tax=Gongylonema pulchrum TaxID=637853 RepID=A0A183EZN3_9BILA|nr:unnamed protein product [Gongylonema pulchrum]
MVDLTDYRTEFPQSLKEIWLQTTKNIQEAQAAAKAYYDKRWNTKTSQFKMGGRVIVSAPTEARRCLHPNLAPRFNGPCRILELSNSSALVKQVYGQEEAI